MKLLRPIFALALAALFSSAEADEPTDIFLLIGQSNMAGRATIEEADLKPITGVSLWNIGEKKWEPAVPPYNRYSPSRKEMKMQKLNCGPSFAKAYQKAHPEAKIGIVCAARGGSSIEQWDREKPDNFDLYRHAVEAAKAALATGGTLKGILWHQGESNSGRADDYPAKLKVLVERLREDLDAPDVPFIFGQIGQWNEKYQKFNEMIVTQPAAIPHSGVVKTDGLVNFDVAHFDSASQRTLGERYAAEILRLQKESATPKK